ncbi:MAG: DNA-3-methyladenine glycosylase I [Terriglobales bacterium]
MVATATAPDISKTVEAIDEMVERINRFKADPQFTQEMEKRTRLVPDFNLRDEEILQRLILLIAYSNAAKASKVTCLVESEVFKTIFVNYSIEKAVELLAKDIVRDHWSELKAIRFKYKVDAMVRCASCLLAVREGYGSFMKYLKDVGLPKSIKSESDIQGFWEGFSRIRAYFLELHLPYFANFTSLCHLLLDLGFGCAKPDSAVMKAAVGLGIVPSPPKQKKNSEKSRAHPEESLKTVVETIQTYAVLKNTRAPVVDLYFLIRGGQSWAKPLVQPAYYGGGGGPSFP